MARRGRPALGTGIRYVFTVLLGTTLSMVIAFVAVRALTRGTQFNFDATTAQVEAAWNLRNCANELTRLTNAMLDAVPTPSAPPALATRTWLAEGFQDDVEALRSELGAGNIQDYAEARGLMDACARLAALALHPNDAGLRATAHAEIARAVDAANEQIRRSGLERRVALPITPLRAL